MKESYKIAVIGCGYWGPNLIRNFNSLPQINVKQVCDLDQKRLTHMKKLYPSVQTTTDVEEIIRDDETDAVAIATPVHLHYEPARRCMLAGKHTFIEKPMASSVAECLNLIELAEKENVTLMVGHTFVYSSAVQKMREIIDAGELGDILYISSQRLNLGLFQSDINVVWDLAPHDISIILDILGKEPIWVNGHGKAHFFDNIEDVATATLQFDNGEIAFLHQSWLDPYKVRRMTVVGSKKMLVYDDVQTNEKIKLFDKRVEAPPHYDTFAEFHFSYRYGDIYIPRLEECEPLKAECEHFVECIKQNKPPKSDGHSGLKIVAILEAICESMRNNGVAVGVNDRNGKRVPSKEFWGAKGKKSSLVV
ncbi:Gfo/Idh/MocA family oxidoreductase [candidate division KSB1 bacterium]|nr:Gfo/Idh/MocA family oxidoreductase [candidate division KSB1 bacterium]NIR68861.1 Gfo/Idh/MocA family oxidoreductase [candidate division KSB1 bacterium]NIS27229.1 Gfo/Idh/MocA family oxidoreductase [candidate division KSB1 bacterium]NIT74114.1 Gfo/Idh/MocA family oxidoreductase [candidate division KSB1 bacterium]NIU27963.1 Gfo/Idh/MocA family oxidoreductase [candidate division KSB1 bacterium]